MFMRKNSLLILVGLLLLAVLFACGRKGSLNPNTKPTISITSYSGVDSFDETTQTIVFQQKIYWSAYDVEGGINGYAFRVLKYDATKPNGWGDPISTTNWEAIDEDGWVYHYKPNVNVNAYTPPLDSPDAAELRQIWTQRVFVTINFPANGEPKTDANGNLVYDQYGALVYEPIPSIFQVKCIDERDEESNIASRVFYAKSATPRVNLISAIDNQVIGKGSVFEFKIFDADDDIPGINATAKEFQFAFLKGTVTVVNGVSYFTRSSDDYQMALLDANGLPTNYDNWDWISTKDEENIDVFRIPSQNPLYSDIVLKSNIPNEVAPQIANALDVTFIFMRVVDLSNIVSDVIFKKFYVYGNFSPETRLYLVDSFILGQNHFQPDYEPGLGKVIPIQQTASGVNYSKRFWLSKEGKYEVIGSNDIKFYFHWGWKGEYKLNDPWGQLDGKVMDRDTNENYNSEIVYFDLRLNGEPLYYPPVPATGSKLQIDEDGTKWLRVSKYDSIFKKITITRPALIHSPQSPGLYGTHTFEVRAVDLQGKGDKQPYVLEFNIVPKVEKADKNGILLINDISSTSALAIVEEKYTEVFNALGVNFEMTNYRTLPNSGLHFGKDKLSPTDMQKYKLVIYNQDVEPHLDANFHNDYTTMYLYLFTGGNLVLSGGKNLQVSHLNSFNSGYFPFLNFFGVGSQTGIPDLGDITFFGSNFLQQPYFVKALPDNGFSTTLNLQIDPPYFSSSFINLTKAIGPIAKLVRFNSTVIYRYGAKLPGTDNYSPTQAWYDEFNGYPVALKNTRANGSKCYLFGFPIIYMQMDGVKSLYQEIMNDLN